MWKGRRGFSCMEDTILIMADTDAVDSMEEEAITMAVRHLF